MTEEEILKKLQEHEVKLDAIFRSTEKTRKYFMWTLIISVIVVVLPLIGLLFTVPTLISGYTDVLQMY